MTGTAIEARVLAAADELFYARGIGDVGVKELRELSAVSLNGLYGRFGSKDGVVAEYLNTRRTAWIDSLRRAVAAESDSHRRLDALFTWLEEWFSEPGFNGCAFIRARAEWNILSAAGRAAVDGHCADLSSLVGEITWGGLDPDVLFILVEGAIVAAQSGDLAAARSARGAALRLASTPTSS